MIANQTRIFLVFHGRFPSEKAASLFAAKSAEAFAGQGCAVTVIAPRRIGRSREDSSTYYGIGKKFGAVFLPTIDIFWIPMTRKVAFVVSYIAFSFSCLLYLIMHAQRSDIVYSNEAAPIFLASIFFQKTVYEVHDFPERKIFFYRLVFSRVAHILVTNRWKLHRLQEMFPSATAKFFFEPNAVEIDDFDVEISSQEAREKLGLPQEAKIAVYTGHLYSWKGTDTLAEAARHLHGEVYFVGGTASDVAVYKAKYRSVPNLHFVGHRPHTEIPLWQKAADVLVLPNTAKEDISKYYTSPMKLFEYMASCKPIVASRIPSVEDIVDDHSVLFTEPDNPESFARAISSVYENKQQAETRAGEARKKVEHHSWEARAKRILGHILHD
jgi:glycosyltransferase involved in cell wall biosynthesis